MRGRRIKHVGSTGGVSRVCSRGGFGGWQGLAPPIPPSPTQGTKRLIPKYPPKKSSLAVVLRKDAPKKPPKSGPTHLNEIVVLHVLTHITHL